MDFARQQLEKYGWKEGMGLGKNEDGIQNPIKPKLKFDNSGIGHDTGAQFTNNWWEKVFNTAAQNINVEMDQGSDNVQMSVKDKDVVEITTKSYSVKEFKKNKNAVYGSFLKTSKLTEKGIEDLGVSAPELHIENKFSVLSDEELFAACGGRTAHKGARHGLKLSGKLSRIEKQEKMLLKKMRKVSLSDEISSNAEKKLKKLKKYKEEGAIVQKNDVEQCSSSSIPLKKKNKKRKSVSFSSTVTQIYTADLDTSLDSEIAGQNENSNEPFILETINSGSDEGIEQDYENNNNNTLEDNHKAFEEARLYINDLSKAERKKLKKKRKLEAKLNTKTNIFLAKLNNEDDETMVEDKDANSKKRKHLEESEQMVCKRSQFSETESPGRLKTKSLKKKRKKQKKLEEKQLNSIAKSLDSVCRISDCE